MPSFVNKSIGDRGDDGFLDRNDPRAEVPTQTVRVGGQLKRIAANTTVRVASDDEADELIAGVTEADLSGDLSGFGKEAQRRGDTVVVSHSQIGRASSKRDIVKDASDSHIRRAVTQAEADLRGEDLLIDDWRQDDEFISHVANELH